MLGMAYQAAKDLDKALSAYRKALEIEPESPQVLYNLGTAYALKQDASAAFEWLERARATRKLDMTQIESDPNLSALKADPRFHALLPTPEIFAQPFVETVNVIREWDGEAANDQFGWIARVVGDVDRDAVPDIVTSAPTKAIGGAGAGRVYLYSTRSGRLLWSVDGKPGDQLGSGVEAAGDTNHDGVPDVIASAPGAGKAYVYSGKDGHTLLTFSAEKTSDNFGQHVSGVGDVNGDGYADVIVGAPGNNAGGEGAGRAYVYSGKDGHILLTLTGGAAQDAFGSAVAGARTKAGSFLIVGAPGAGPRHAGRAYVYKGLSPTPAFVIDADETGTALGAMFLSVIGDVNHDGVPDVYASDFTNAAKGPATGRVYVHSGADGRRLLTLTGETAGEGFGIGPATAGDVDGDGHDDLIVGAWQYAGAAISGGRVLSILRQGWHAAEDLHVPHARRHVRIRRRRHGRCRRRRHDRLPDHVGVERHPRLPLRPDVHHLERHPEALRELRGSCSFVLDSDVVQAFRPANTADLKVRTSRNRKRSRQSAPS